MIIIATPLRKILIFIQKIVTSQTQEVTIAVSSRIFKPLQLSHIVSQFQNLRMFLLKRILFLRYQYL